MIFEIRDCSTNSLVAKADRNNIVDVLEKIIEEQGLYVVKKEQEGLKFKCPECGHDRLECVMHGEYTSVITNLDEDCDFYYGEIIGNGHVEHYRCVHCGYELTDENGWLIDENEKVIEWVKEICEQS